MFLSWNILYAGDMEYLEQSRVANERAIIIEEKLIYFWLKNDIPLSHIIEVIETYIEKSQLSEQNKRTLAFTKNKLKNRKVEFVLPDHWPLSSPEIVWTYRLHHWYRENYLKYKNPQVVSSYIYKKDTSEKIVYLTFDDGPYNQQKAVVDYLMNNKIPSTFFLICNKINATNIAPYKTDFITLAMHTNTHSNYDQLTKDQILNDIDACNKMFDAHNIEKRLFRPAFGIVNMNESKALAMNNLNGVIWSMDSLDWASWFNEQRIDEMLESVSPGEIILFHENADITMFVKFVDWLKEKGYSFWKM